MTNERWVVGQDEKTALVLDPRDNVAVALTRLNKGEKCVVRYEDRHDSVEVLEDIEFGHKFALIPLAAHHPVLKYGEEIGRMKQEVAPGQWIHLHNMYCERGRT